jgi:hypothetical protein
LNLSQVDLPKDVARIGAPAGLVNCACKLCRFTPYYFIGWFRASNGITTSQALAFDLGEHLLARCRFALCALGGSSVVLVPSFLLYF